MFKKFVLAVAALSMMGASALAASDGALDNKEMMKPFYSDDGMTTLRSTEELTVAIKAMATNDRDKLAKECMDTTSQKNTFCQSFNEINKTK